MKMARLRDFAENAQMPHVVLAFLWHGIMTVNIAESVA